jgi:hypothetical protein
MRWLADENFNGTILKDIRKADPQINIVRVQNTPVFQADDPTVLEWAAQEGCIILTHDVHTMIGFAYDRVKAGLPMPGIVEVHSDTPIGQAVDELLFIIGAGVPDDFENQVRYIPM